MNEPQIIYKDDALLIIDKPAGMIVNKADTTKGEVTVQEWVEQKFPILNKDESDFHNRAGIVHRLDKETSGILLIARTLPSFENLQKQFKERVVKKSYIALAHGAILPQVGEIRVPVGRLPWNRKQFGVVAGGKEAVTRYRVISNFKFPISKAKEELSLVELYPETGRTHQIRVHLKYIGHPIFADFLYAGRKTAREDRRLLSRVFLHAAKISFLHPKTGEEISFESPLPEELQKVLNQESF